MDAVFSKNVLRGLIEASGGLTTGDVDDNGAGYTVVKRSFVANNKLAKLASPFQVKDYNAVDGRIQNLEIELAEKQEGGEVPLGTRLEEHLGLPAQLRIYGARVIASREMVVNDNIPALNDAWAMAGRAAARLTNRLICGVLEDNANLADGQPIFDSAFGNDLSAALTEASVAAAMAALRAQEAATGVACDLAAAFALVPPTDELGARKIVKECGLNIEVLSSAFVTEGTYYLLADPKESPVLGLMKPMGNDPLTVNARASRGGGLEWHIFYDVAVTALGRVGAVRVVNA
ncbi:MAG: hypothetical protein CMK32_03860 [Porticoccaceae bacterium]|nr:hypothetical protein [Porticoccaceae bacterium]